MAADNPNCSITYCCFRRFVFWGHLQPCLVFTNVQKENEKNGATLTCNCRRFLDSSACPPSSTGAVKAGASCYTSE
eukprot:1975323-Rhodomonas_salina.1